MRPDRLYDRVPAMVFCTFPRRPLLLFTLCLTGLAAGCTATTSGRTEHAAAIAAPSQLQRTQYNAAPFTLAAWEKIARPGEPIHIYIEGDGLAWLSRGRLSSNPTPKNPVGLLLAGKDTGANVLYLARPCQYTPLDAPGNEACASADYWSGKRFAPDVINSYMTVLDNVATRTGTKEFHVTGFSGGANIAGLLAARRTDITQIRTVAGNIDNDYSVRLHKVTPMPESLNMADDAPRLASIPQIHFIGADDNIVPALIFQSYAMKAGASSCIHHQILPGIDHHDGWDTQWPSLQTIPVTCH